ncbi:hypothetical protein N8612_00055 [Verrucomicrobia bacterium]|jgi:hypothetical protein|nr:hypothetical protein [Verrucomicrobiota bacterium]
MYLTRLPQELGEFYDEFVAATVETEDKVPFGDPELQSVYIRSFAAFVSTKFV